VNAIIFVTKSTELWTLREPTVKRDVILKKICIQISPFFFIQLDSEKCKSDDCASKCIKTTLGDDESGGLGSKFVYFMAI